MFSFSILFRKVSFRYYSFFRNFEVILIFGFSIQFLFLQFRCYSLFRCYSGNSIFEINQFGCFRYCYCYPVEGGVIDNDYRGEISVLLKNNNDSEFIIKTDLAIAQLVILQRFSPQLFIVVPES